MMSDAPEAMNMMSGAGDACAPEAMMSAAGSDDDCSDDSAAGASMAIPDTAIVIMDMRKYGEVLPKALRDSFGPVVELCQATPDACKEP